MGSWLWPGDQCVFAVSYLLKTDCFLCSLIFGVFCFIRMVVYLLCEIPHFLSDYFQNSINQCQMLMAVTLVKATQWNLARSAANE